VKAEVGSCIYQNVMEAEKADMLIIYWRQRGLLYKKCLHTGGTDLLKISEGGADLQRKIKCIQKGIIYCT